MQIYLFHIVSPNFPHTFFENVHISVTVAQAEIVVHDNMTIAGFIVRG